MDLRHRQTTAEPLFESTEDAVACFVLSSSGPTGFSRSRTTTAITPSPLAMTFTCYAARV